MQGSTQSYISPEQFEYFYQSATFLIGLCAVAGGTFIVIASLTSKDFRHRFRKWLVMALVTLILAGAIGGFVAGHILFTGYAYPGNLYKASFFFMHFLFWLGLVIGLAGLWRVFWHAMGFGKQEVKETPERHTRAGRGRTATTHTFQLVRACPDMHLATARAVHLVRVPKGRRRKARLSVYVPHARVKEFK